eukprot:TRINITY_DN16883_c0_g3_i2.p1 TRINITY_DN16883_c0_g3~~TRINITY_DN16883_c0_g3_i2.p1  ORF type:complete len:320 (+),score=61.15 TRINITY_DN16883_c0_g3_i2:32-991(+)
MSETTYETVILLEELSQLLENDQSDTQIQHSLKKILQASRCTQFFDCRNNQNFLSEEQENFDPDFKIMGVTKEDLLKHSGGQNFLQLNKQKLIQLVDQQFSERIQQFARIFRFDENKNQNSSYDQNFSAKNGEDFKEDFLGHFSRQFSQNSENMKLMEKYIEQIKSEQCKYVQILQNIFQEIQQIIQNDMLQTQRKQDEEQCKLCLLECEQIQLQLQNLHGKILTAFYTPENLQKLRKINDNLDVGLKSAEKYKNELNRRLQLFKNQGVEFEEVVKQYEQIKNQRKKQKEYQRWLQGLNEELAQEQSQINLEDEIQDDF